MRFLVFIKNEKYSYPLLWTPKSTDSVRDREFAFATSLAEMQLTEGEMDRLWKTRIFAVSYLFLHSTASLATSR